jgi:DNA modification methylase
MSPRPKAISPKDHVSTIRFSSSEHREMERQAKLLGFHSISEYIRALHAKNVKTQLTLIKPVKKTYTQPRRYFASEYGEAMLGNSLGLLHHKLAEQSVDLIMTSPPFGLVRKKSYGNKDADEYLEWFRPFAAGFKRVLKLQGSLAIDIGGAWKPGFPTRSLYHYELLIMLCREFGFHLAQDHFWWNPAKLPTPAEWVNIRRIRVKDGINCVWWLSPTPWPKANNRRVLAPYSESMKDLLENGYQAKLRPSGHNISTKFSINNGGAIPPNLLAIANTESNGKYQSYCRANDIPVHPARFPSQLPEYFIRMCTDIGDLVVDPFAGSCVTGEVAEKLKRQWICCELQEDYLQGARGRFLEQSQESSTTVPSTYEIFAPCSLPNDDTTLLESHGGSIRSLKKITKGMSLPSQSSH